MLIIHIVNSGASNELTNITYLCVFHFVPQQQSNKKQITRIDMIEHSSIHLLTCIFTFEPDKPFKSSFTLKV